MSDPVRQPPHYTRGKIEVLDFILDQQLPYCLGNVVKYVCRCDHKGQPIQDLEKAIQYLQRELAERKKQNTDIKERMREALEKKRVPTATLPPLSEATRKD